jgi:leucyl-tRNA synthetase
MQQDIKPQEYKPEVIEAAAQQYWEDTQAFRARKDAAKKKYYCLSMFPYPSGKLHMGHVRNYTIGDVLARYHRMNNFNVLQPMGWDAFGLPAENAAIANKVPPAKWTYDNIAHMKDQLKKLGFAIDWERELATCQPEYYKWNQWLFLRMLERGIAYKKTQVVNWDPVDQTVLANEQVIDGRGWRTGALVEKREIPGYYLGITQFAEELVADLDKLPGWPERVKTMQANWIGKSYGVRFAFPYMLDGREEKLWVYTTRADTIMGVTFVAVAAEHPLAHHAAKNNPAVAAFVEKCKHTSVMEADMATMEKEGVDTRLTVTHPLTGEQVPVWVGNYVLMGYGEGAVMAVPAHDERDFAFTQKYKDQLPPIQQVIELNDSDKLTVDQELRAFTEALSKGASSDNDPLSFDKPQGWAKEHLQEGINDKLRFSNSAWREWYADKTKGVCVNSGKYNGKGYQDAVDAIAADLKAKGLGDKQVQWRLRDWGISRQRYWGCPIPIIHCDACGSVPVPDEQLPVVLPEDCVPDGSGNPLLKREDFLNCTCPKCGMPAKRETDTMDTFVDSSWYYARYASQFKSDAMVDEETSYWMPVDQYIGGIEHAILHLLYSRFWTKVMRDVDLVNYDEPFSNLLTQGMVLNHIFSRHHEKGGIEYFAPEEVAILKDEAGRITGAKSVADGSAVDYLGIGTMSKSKLNGVDPQAIIDKYGADTARLFMMFASPPEQTLEWADSGVEGAHRFLKRVWAFAIENRGFISQGIKLHTDWVDWNKAPNEFKSARREIHLLLKQANYDLGRLQFNTVVSAAMKMLNTIERFPGPMVKVGSSIANQPVYAALIEESFSILLRLLSPITPHITHVLWLELGYDGDILASGWPKEDEAALVQDEIELVVQVNGKLRGSIRVPNNAGKDEIERMALASEVVQKQLNGGAAKKVIIVPGRLVNVVI